MVVASTVRTRNQSRSGGASTSGSPVPMRSGRSHCGGPFSGTRIADVSDAFGDQRVAVALVDCPHARHDVVAAAAQQPGFETKRAVVLARDEPRREIRGHDPTVGKRRQPAAHSADVVEEREDRARVDRAAVVAEVVWTAGA